MLFKSVAAASLLSVAALANPVADRVDKRQSPQQTAEILSAIVSYGESLTTNAALVSAAQALVSEVPAPVLLSLYNELTAGDLFAPPTDIPLSGLAQRPISALEEAGIPEALTALPDAALDDILPVVTDFVLAEASIVRSVLSIPGGAAPAPSSGGGGGGGEPEEPEESEAPESGGGGGSGSGSGSGSGGGSSGGGESTSTGGAALPTGLGIQVTGLAVGALGVAAALL